jgi:hypothetical protein
MNTLALRAMTGAIILYDHVAESGAFCKRSPVHVCATTTPPARPPVRARLIAFSSGGTDKGLHSGVAQQCELADARPRERAPFHNCTPERRRHTFGDQAGSSVARGASCWRGARITSRHTTPHLIRTPFAPSPFPVSSFGHRNMRLVHCLMPLWGQCYGLAVPVHEGCGTFHQMWSGRVSFFPE